MNTKRSRMLLAMDCDKPDAAAVRVLFEIASDEAVEMVGLYVEDEELLRAANLPGLKEIFVSGRSERLDPERIAHDLSRQAAAAQRGFDDLARQLAAEHRGLQSHFLRARGRLAEELDRAAAETDMVLVARSQSGGLRRHHGVTFRGLLHRPGHVLIVNEPWDSGTAVVVVPAPGAVPVAERLARAEGLRLVIAAADDRSAGLAEVPFGAQVRRLARIDEATLADLCLAEDARLLVVGADGGLDQDVLVTSLMDRLPCSVLRLAPAAAAGSVPHPPLRR